MMCDYKTVVAHHKLILFIIIRLVGKAYGLAGSKGARTARQTALPRRRFSHGITPVKAAPAPLRCAPAGDTVCRDRVLLSSEVLLPRSFGE